MKRVKTSYSLVLGGAANASGTRLYAQTPVADHVVIVDPTPLTALSVAAEPYVRGACVGVPVADVGALTVSSGGERWRRYRRTLKGWGEAPVDADADGNPGAVSLLDTDAAARVEALNTFLTEAAPSRVVLEPPAGFEPSVRIELGSLDMSPLEVIEVGSMGAGASTQVVVRTGPVFRVFGAENSGVGGVGGGGGEAIDPLLGQLLGEQAVRAATGASASGRGDGTGGSDETGVTGVDVTK